MHLYLLVIYCGQVTWLCLALLVSAASHAVLAWTRVSPYLAIVTMGLAYSVLASALWSLPAILLPPHQLATAFGIMQVNTQFGFVRKIFELIDLIDIIIDTRRITTLDFIPLRSTNTIDTNTIDTNNK